MIHTLQNGKFAILKILGQGGFGITYEASNTKLGKRVAIKELFLDYICLRENDGTTVTVTSEEKRNLFESQKDRFIQEAGKLAKLSHPHIVAVHDLFEENGTAYYVMDYIEGESLAAHLSHTGQPMNENDVLNILYQVLDALAYLHARKPPLLPLLHLDIKPDNLMRKEDGNIVLIDFGASKNMPQDDRKLSTTLAYTPRFAPQEQADHDIKNIGPWTDFYSLGATLYNLLTNNRPPNTTELLKDKTEDMHEALPFPVSVSTPMRHLVRQLMSIDQTKRPQSVEEIRKILHENAEQERIAKEQAEKERIAKEQAEQERIAKKKAEQERIAKEQAEKERIAKEQAEATRIAKEEDEKTILANNPGDKAEKTEQTEKTKVIDDTPDQNTKPKKWKMALITGGTVAAIGIAAVLLLPKINVVIDETDKEILRSKIATNNSDTISENDTIDIISPTEQTERKQEEELSQKQKEEQQKKQKEELAKKQKEEQQKKQKEEQEKKQEEINQRCKSLFDKAQVAYDNFNYEEANSFILSIEGISVKYAQRNDVRTLKSNIIRAKEKQKEWGI